MDLSHKVMILLRALREGPHRQPPVNAELEERLDIVDKKLERLVVRQYRQAELHRK